MPPYISFPRIGCQCIDRCRLVYKQLLQVGNAEEKLQTRTGQLVSFHLLKIFKSLFSDTTAGVLMVSSWFTDSGVSTTLQVEDSQNTLR